MDSSIGVLAISIMALIMGIILITIVYLVYKAKKHPLYNKAKESNDKYIINKIVNDTIEDHLSGNKFYNRIEAIIDKHLSPEAIEKTVLEVTEQLKREGKISKDFSWDKVKKKGEENEVR